MSQLSRDIKRTLLLKGILLFLLWYVCVHGIKKHKVEVKDSINHFLNTSVVKSDITADPKTEQALR